MLCYILALSMNDLLQSTLPYIFLNPNCNAFEIIISKY